MDRIGQSAYDLIITDLSMPGMSGVELAQAVKAEKPSQKVVLLTGTPPITALHWFDALILKPFSLDDFKRTISALI
jgi:CheY-like chemotaxis protein